MSFGLLIDTSSDFLILVLTKNQEVLSATRISHNNRLAQEMLPEIQLLLETHQIKKKALAFIGLGIGPGSYTGTRIGAAIARTLSYALGIPLIGIPSLFFLGEENEEPFAVIQASKSGNFFCALRLNRSAEPEFFSSLKWDEIQELLKKNSLTRIYSKALENPPCSLPLSPYSFSPKWAAMSVYNKFLTHSKETLNFPRLIYLEPIC